MTVVADSELAQHIHATTVVLILEGQLGNRGELSGLLDNQIFQIFRSDLHGRAQGDTIDMTLLPLTTCGSRHGEDAQRGLDIGRQGIAEAYGLFRLLVIDNHDVGEDILVILTPDLHLQRLRLLQQVIVEGVEMLWIEVDVDGLLVIGDDVMDAALTAILGIELQVLDDIAQQHARLQDLYLVVDTGRIGEET